MLEVEKKQRGYDGARYDLVLRGASLSSRTHPTGHPHQFGSRAHIPFFSLSLSLHSNNLTYTPGSIFKLKALALFFLSANLNHREFTSSHIQTLPPEPSFPLTYTNTNVRYNKLYITKCVFNLDIRIMSISLLLLLPL